MIKEWFMEFFANIILALIILVGAVALLGLFAGIIWLILSAVEVFGAILGFIIAAVISIIVISAIMATAEIIKHRK